MHDYRYLVVPAYHSIAIAVRPRYAQWLPLSVSVIYDQKYKVLIFRRNWC